MPTPLSPLKINKLEDSAAGRAIAAVNNASGILHEFVDFTSDLVRNVLKTMVDSSIEQLEAYATLVAKVSGTVAEYEYRSLGGDTGAAALKYINEVVLPIFGAVDAQGNPVNPTLTAAPSTSDPTTLTFTPATISLDPGKLADLDGSFANVIATVALPSTSSTTSTALSTTPKETTLDQALTKTFDTADPTKLTALTIPAASLYAFAIAKLRHEVKASYDKIVTILQLGMQKVVFTEGKIAASVSFHVDSSESDQLKSSQTQSDFSAKSSGWSVNAAFAFNQAQQQSLAGNILSRSFGGSIGGGGGSSKTQTSTKVNVLNETKSAATNLNVDITGSVEIKFRSDFFPAFNPASVPVPA